MPTDRTNQRLSAKVVASGILLQLVGLLFGLAVTSAPFKRLALSAHIQYMSQGAMVTVAGLVLSPSANLVHPLSPLKQTLLNLGQLAIWPVVIAESFNGWWATHEFLQMAYLAQNTTHVAQPWQEQIQVVAHAVGGVGLIGFMALLAWEVVVVGPGFQPPVDGKKEA